MTTLTQPGEMTLAPDLISMPFVGVGEAEVLSAFAAARIAPEQVAGAYSLLKPRPQFHRPFFGRGRSGLFFSKKSRVQPRRGLHGRRFFPGAGRFLNIADTAEHRFENQPAFQSGAALGDVQSCRSGPQTIDVLFSPLKEPSRCPA